MGAGGGFGGDLSGSTEHTFLEHVSELALRIRAPSERALLLEAGRALSQQLRRDDPGTPVKTWRPLTIQGDDTAGVLVDWLNELIYLAEADRWVPTEFRNAELSPEAFTVEARGVQLERAPALIKAATFHGLEIEKTDGDVEAEVIFDV